MKKYELENIIRNNAKTLCKMHCDIESIKEIQKTIMQTQEKGLVEKKKLVIIHDGGVTRIYQNGKEITEGIRSVTFEAGEIPIIEYQKVVGDE